MITVELTAPGAFHAKTPLGDWFVSAANAERIKQELQKPSFLALVGKEQVLRLGSLADDGILLYVPGDGSSLWLYRTINGMRDFYYRSDHQGNWFFADHFRNAIAAIPVKERFLEETALLDHLLFQYSLGESTRLKKVRRIASGEMRLIFPSEGTERCWQQERISVRPFYEDREKAVSDLERAFEELLKGSDSADCTLFSGGVDSSLLHAFRPIGSKALSVWIDSPEFSFEAEYSREAARLLGADWSSVAIREEDYASLFSETVESLGQPLIVNFQPVLLHVAFQAPFDIFWLADCSDTLFGHTCTRKIMNPAERETILERLKEPFDSPRSYAANADLSPDIQVVRRLFGEEAVEKRMEKRLSFVLERSSVHAGNLEEQQAELVSLVEFLGSTTEGVSRKRQDAAVFGKEAREPFCSRKILEVATATRPVERFFSDGEVKPLPKALLRKKLPEYPFFGRKGGSDIPRTRFCQTGPYRDFFREHAFPDGMPSEGKTLLLDPQWDWSHMTLAAAAFSVWQEKILENETLEQVPGTRVFRLEAKGNLESEKARS